MRERLDAWNRNNPDQKIVVKMPDVWKRVREMGKSKDERIAATAPKAMRQQISSALCALVHVTRLSDGKRKVVSIEEITGMEGEIIITQDLFRFAYDTSDFSDKVKGTFDSSHIRPGFIERARYYGLEAALMDVMQS